jgi:hypothetical protein
LAANRGSGRVGDLVALPGLREFHMLVVDITRNRSFHPLQAGSSSQHTGENFGGKGLER